LEKNRLTQVLINLPAGDWAAGERGIACLPDRVGEFQAGDELEVDFAIECWLTPQQYTLTVATQSSDGSSHDWLDDAITFDVVDTRVAAGVANLRAKVAWRVSR